MSNDFHDKRFDEGTLTKLQLFELYTREWLPVFLSKDIPIWRAIHIFDFFAGPGTDLSGEFGSPLRILRQIDSYRSLAGFSKTRVEVHFFDENKAKIQRLKTNIRENKLEIAGVHQDARPLRFSLALEQTREILESDCAAKLIFADQCGVDQITPDVFRSLVGFPTCDFMFFISSSTLHRFRDHPAIRQKIKRPEDYYHVHRAVLDYYRSLLPNPRQHFLAPFSLKKGSNIYGVIFGSGHPLGMEKFLRVAWETDELNGEADFDINRDDILPGEMLLPLDEFRPSKVTAFEHDLEKAIRDGKCPTELEVARKCFEHGVTCRHAKPVLKKLKKEGIARFDFEVPSTSAQHLRQPRPIALI